MASRMSKSIEHSMTVHRVKRLQEVKEKLLFREGVLTCFPFDNRILEFMNPATRYTVENYRQLNRAFRKTWDLVLIFRICL
jgi:hypothetical protein